MNKPVLIAPLLLALVLFLGGCVKAGPDFTRPAPPADMPAAYRNLGMSLNGKGPVSATRWWEEFKDPELNALVEEVLQNNLDLKKGVAAILEIQASLKSTRAARFPSLTANGGYSRSQQTVTNVWPVLSGTRLGYVTKEQMVVSDLYSLNLAAAYELDLWGRIARSEEAALADLLAVRENARTLAQSLAAEAVRLHFEIESVERKIQIAKKSIEIYVRSKKLVDLRYEGGLASILDVRQARRLLSQAEATLPPLRNQLGSLQQQMSVLLGRYPGTAPAESHPEEYLADLPAVPPGLPSGLLLRRPDILSAEARLQAASARIGAARAARFPTISLTGKLGYSSTELDQLFTPQAFLWNLAAGLTAPLFDAGKRKAAEEAAEARFAQEEAAYAKTVLSAFSEVEGALLSRKELWEQRRRLLSFLEEARGTETAARTRYEGGLTSYLSVLEAQQTRFAAENQVVSVDYAILANRVALYRALGGGWEGNK